MFSGKQQAEKGFYWITMQRKLLKMLPCPEK